MSDGFEQMVDAALPFFAELEQNNSKDWFDPRKAQYTEEIKKPAEFFGELIAEDLSRMTGRGHKAKLFRIYRDVRFSKDKTPLNTHLHLMWSDPKGTDLSPVYFFGLSSSYFMVGGGVMGLKGETLAAFRAHVDRHGDAVQDALNEAAGQGITLSDWGPEPLKRVPKPFAADHPQADLLKRKALAISGPVEEGWRAEGLVKSVCARLKQILPVMDVLSPV